MDHRFINTFFQLNWISLYSVSICLWLKKHKLLICVPETNCVFYHHQHFTYKMTERIVTVLSCIPSHFIFWMNTGAHSTWLYHSLVSSLSLLLSVSDEHHGHITVLSHHFHFCFHFHFQFQDENHGQERLAKSQSCLITVQGKQLPA